MQDPGAYELSIQQELALSALLAGCSASAAADQAGCDRHTVQRWRSRPGPFRLALQSRLSERREMAEAGLSSMLPAALQTLREILENGQQEACKIAAVRLVLEHVMGEHALGRTSSVKPEGYDDAIRVPELRAVLDEIAKRQEAASA